MKTSNELFYIAFIGLTLLLTSCKKQVDKYIIGDNAHGGIVFFVDESGVHGLVYSITDQSTGAIWGVGEPLWGGLRGILVQEIKIQVI
jgi:hypothetical protein